MLIVALAAITVSGANFCVLALRLTEGLLCLLPDFSMANIVLIVSNSADLHVDLVLPLLRQPVQSFRLDLDCFPRDYQLWQSFSAGKIVGKLRHLPTDEQIALEDITAVWLRKPADFSFRATDLAAQELAFAKEETEHALLGLLYALNCFWVSHPLQLRGAMWKIEQLHRAQQFGFQIPPSLVCNLPAAVQQFAEGKQVIFKTLSTPLLGAELVSAEDCIAEGLPTTLLSADDLLDLEAVQELPCHFQHYIHKAYELRVTVIGDRVFAARIDSQDDERTKVDCRDMSAPVRYSAYQLPAALAQRCVDFVHSYGLHYSAMDFIRTPDQHYVFLENNPNGQFLYIEQLIPEFQLCQALADLLVQGALCRN